MKIRVCVHDAMRCDRGWATHSGWVVWVNEVRVLRGVSGHSVMLLVFGQCAVEVEHDDPSTQAISRHIYIYISRHRGWRGFRVTCKESMPIMQIIDIRKTRN